MVLYQVLTILLLSLVLIPYQVDLRIKYAIFGYALLLLPIFVKNLMQREKLKDLTTLFFLLFLIATGFSAIYSPSLIGWLQFFLYFSYFIIFTSIPTIFPTLKSKELLASGYLFVVTILALISMYNTIFGHMVNREVAGVSFMWNYLGHNHLSALLLFAIPISIYFVKKHWKDKYLNILYLITSYILLMSLFLCFGIGPIICLGIVALVVLIKNFRKRFILSLLMLCLVSFLLTGLIYLNRGFGLTKNPVKSFSARIGYWQTAVKNFQKSPIFGVGVKTAKASKNTIVMKSTHNFYLQMLTDAGILGFITIIGLIGRVIYKAGKNVGTHPLSMAILVGVSASTLTSFVDIDWQISSVFLIFWLFASLLVYNRFAETPGVDRG